MGQQKALVFDGQCKYDVIFGTDFMFKTGINIKYSTEIIEWFDNELPMNDPPQLDNKEYLAMAEVLQVQRQLNNCLAWIGMIQPASLLKYWTPSMKKVSADDVVNQLTHQNNEQNQDLKVLFKDNTRLFDSTLGVYLHKKFHINLIPGAKPKHSQPYAIHCIHLAAFKK